MYIASYSYCNYVHIDMYQTRDVLNKCTQSSIAKYITYVHVRMHSYVHRAVKILTSIS